MFHVKHTVSVDLAFHVKRCDGIVSTPPSPHMPTRKTGVTACHTFYLLTSNSQLTPNF